MNSITGRDLYLEDIVVNYSNNFKNNKINLGKLKELINNENRYDNRLKNYINDWIKDKYNDEDLVIQLNTEIISNNQENGIISNRYILKDVNNNIIWNEILPFVLKQLAEMEDIEYLYYDNEVVPVDDLDVNNVLNDLQIDLNKYNRPEEASEKEDYIELDKTIINESDNEEENSDFMDSLNKLREMGIV